MHDKNKVASVSSCILTLARFAKIMCPESTYAQDLIQLLTSLISRPSPAFRRKARQGLGTRLAADYNKQLQS